MNEDLNNMTDETNGVTNMTEIDKDEKVKKDAKESSLKKEDQKSKEHKKAAEYQSRIEALENQLSQLKDQYLRKVAEFENYKRRTEKEFLAHLEYATEGLITDILPVLDDFERSLQHMEQSNDAQVLREGVDLIYKKLISVLEKKGLKVMETIGLDFDAEKHQALMQIESDVHESGKIVDQHLKGYLLNDKVIRHAQVLVAK
jgi:molecular chaperone GrpE